MFLLRHRIIEWKNTEERYVAVVQAIDRFDPTSLREFKRSGDEAWVVGRLRNSIQEDLYAVALRRVALEYSEARERAQQAVDHYNDQRAQGLDPLAPR